jgi:hypothetical protein
MVIRVWLMEIGVYSTEANKMKRTITVSVLFVMLLAASFADIASALDVAMPDHLISYYNEYVKQEIDGERQEASLLKGDSPALRCSAELHSAKADFYESNKDQLVQEMVMQDIGMEPHKIDHFLTTSFFSTDPRQKIAACEMDRQEG